MVSADREMLQHLPKDEDNVSESNLPNQEEEEYAFASAMKHGPPTIFHETTSTNTRHSQHIQQNKGKVPGLKVVNIYFLCFILS